MSAAFLRELGARRSGSGPGRTASPTALLYAMESAAGDTLVADLQPFL